MIDVVTGLGLFAAGVAGGAVNAIAGGATLLTFPAMVAAGLPPVIANASSAVAVTPGHFVAALADRAMLPAPRALVAPLVAGALGGGLGAALLLATSDSTFTMLVPALVGVATALFAFARPIQAAIRARFGQDHGGAGGRAAAISGVSVYGGYFGAGLGVMLLAVLSITGHEELRAANALKNAVSAAVSLATIAIFIGRGAVDWPPTLAMLAGALAGGFLGVRLLRVLKPQGVRALVVVIGAAMTAIYAWKYWM